MKLRKLKHQLAKRNIKVKSDIKQYRRFITTGELDRTTSAWFNEDEPDFIYVVRVNKKYKVKNIVYILLHEYRHWLQLHRKKAIWHTYMPAEQDAERFAERALRYF